LLSPLLGTSFAGIAFALALLAAGQSSTLTGTLAGQIVMEGYLHFKIRPFLRRFITRFIAIVPAVLTILFTGDQGSYDLLILSQVVLSMQLPFAIIPLIHFTSDRKLMGDFANATWVKTASWTVAVIVVGLNIRLVASAVGDWIASSTDPLILYVLILPLLAGVGALLLYVTLKPFVRLPQKDHMPAWKKLRHFVLAGDDMLDLEVPKYRRIGVAVAFDDNDLKVLSHAYGLARQHDATLCLFHVVEGASGTVYGSDAYDAEAREDAEYLDKLATSLGVRGIEVETSLGYGAVPREIVRLALEQHIDLLVMGAHGHRTVGDFIFGSTIEPVRHELRIPLIIVR
jgi:manganese transport protein